MTEPYVLNVQPPVTLEQLIREMVQDLDLSMLGDELPPDVGYALLLPMGNSKRAGSQSGA